MNRPREGDGTPKEQRQKRAVRTKMQISRVWRRTHGACLKAGAHSGVLGRSHGPAGDRPATVGGGRLHPGRWTSPQPARGPPGSTAAIGGRAGGALPDRPSPSRVPSHLRVPSRQDSHQPHRAAASNYCRKPSTSRRGPQLDAPPRRPTDWPAQSHVICVATRTRRPLCAHAQ